MNAPLVIMTVRFILNVQMMMEFMFALVSKVMNTIPPLMVISLTSTLMENDLVKIGTNVRN